jgi:predicted nuclease of predicted toxin-antitoxin system
VNVLVDAHLPKRLADLLSEYEVNAKHTLDLPEGNATPDHEIILIADKEKRIVITKDRDFWDSHILNRSPEKLLIVSTGNIRNQILIQLFEKNIETLKKMFEKNSVIELNDEEIQIHY